MLNSEKNRNAESVIKELGDVEPEFFAVFEIEELLNSECSYAILSIYKAYIERRSAVMQAESTVKILIADDAEKQ
jgi:hypothetical protein